MLLPSTIWHSILSKRVLLVVTCILLVLQDVITVDITRVKRQSEEEDLGLVQVKVSLPSNGQVPGRYLVQLKQNNGRQDGIRALGLRMGRGQLRGARIRSAVKVGRFNSVVVDAQESQVQALRESSEVQQVEPVVYVTKQQVPCDVQSNPPWNLDRIDQSASTLDSQYSFGASDGEGVIAYVLDTGVDGTHVDFAGRVETGASFCMGCDNVDGCPDICGVKDGDGHGTHVAGIIASNTYGVAKKTTIIGVKILNDDGIGTSEDVINALRWVLRDVRKRKKECKAVVNMSIGGPKSNLENQATNSLVRAGVPIIAASGNEGIDACLTSPASARGSISVGSVGRRDRRSSFSNWGKCVNVLAPGERIASLRNSRTGAVAYSGTSMAAPHVSGAVAIFLGRLGGAGSCGGVKTWLSDNGAKGVIRGLRGERNLVLNVPCNGTKSNNNDNTNKPATQRPVTVRTTRRPRPAQSNESLLDFLSNLFQNNNNNNNRGGGGRGWLFGR